MAENKQNKDHEQEPKNIKPGSLKRSTSSDGRESSSSCKASRVHWDDYTTARGDDREYQCTATTPVIWDNWTATSSARGDTLMDIEGAKSPQMVSETRKRKGNDLTNHILEKKHKCQRYLSSLTTTQTICEPCKEMSECLEDRSELNEKEGIALYSHEIPVRDVHVLSAIVSKSKATTSDAGSQTAKSPLVPVTPVVSFFEPAPEEPVSLEMSYFGAGARLEDGSLRPPPVICAPGACTSKDTPQDEKSVEAAKEWMRGGNDPPPQAQAKQVHTQEEDPKKENNTDRYLKMF